MQIDIQSVIPIYRYVCQSGGELLFQATSTKNWGYWLDDN